MASEAWEKLFGVVEDFKEELRSWSSKEHAAVQEQAEEAEALKGVLEVSEEPWEHVTELLHRAKAQKEQLSKMSELLHKHAKLLEGSKEKLPQGGAPASAEELRRLVVAALEHIVQKPEAEAGKETHEAQEGSEEVEEKKAKKKVAKPKKSKTKEKKSREETRQKKSSKELESDGSEDYSDYSSYSRTPTPRPRRRRKRRRRRRRPSPSSYSYTPSPRPRRKRRRREDKLDVDGEIDRFVKVNKLEERCEKILRDLDSSLACKVMGLSGGNNTFELSGDVRDPTAVVLARIRKAQFARDDGTRGPVRRGARRRSSSSR